MTEHASESAEPTLELESLRRRNRELERQLGTVEAGNGRDPGGDAGARASPLPTSDPAEEARLEPDVLRSMVEEAVEGIAVFSDEGRLVFANRSFAKIYRYESWTDIAGRTGAEFVAPDDRARFGEWMQAHPGGADTPGRFECAGLRADGSLVRIEQSATPIVWQGAIGTKVTHVDVSERWRIEQRLRMALRIGQTGYWQRDLAGGPTYISKEMGRILGLAPEALQGDLFALFLERVHPEDREPLLARIGAALASGAPIDAQYRIVRPDGEVCHVHARTEVLCDASGNTIALFGVSRDMTEQHHIEQALRRSEERFRTVVEQASDGILLSDQQGSYVEVNRAGCEMLGYTHEELLGMRLTDVAAPESLEQAPVAWDRLKAGEVVVRRRDLVRKDGARLPTEIGARILSDGRYLGIVRTVTGLQRVQEDLRRSEERLAQILDVATDAIVSADEQQQILLFNKGAERVFGYAAEEVLGQPLEMLLPLNSRGRHRENINRFERTGVTSRLMSERGEVRGVRKDGTAFPAEASISRIQWRDGTVYTAHLRDITERKAAEAELRLSEQRLTEAHRLAGLGAWKIDLRSEESWWSDEQYKMFGISKDDRPIRSEAFADLLPPSDRDNLKLAFDAAIRDGVWEGDYRIVRPNGEQRELHGIVVASYDPNGQPILLSGTNQDITERRAIEEQLRHSQKMDAVGQLAGGVAHEFNNMLQVVLGYTQICLRTPKLPERVETNLRHVVTFTERASDITRRLLAFSRRHALKLRPLDIVELVANQMKLMRPVLGETIAVEVRSTPTALPVTADPGMIEQVLMNLCINARDAMPDGGRLTVRVGSELVDDEFCAKHGWARPGLYAFVSVTDSGLGMEPGVRERVFEPFFTTKGVGQGTGLGLSIAYGIMQQHSGMITVESTPGQGSAFTAYLPAVGSLQAEATVDEPPADLSGQGTVLLAEDEPNVRALAVALLGDAGYTVLSATDGPEAVALFERHADAIELAVLDVVMPGGGGYKALERMRETNPKLPALFTTGYSPEQVRSDLLDDDRVAMLQKPYSRASLLRSIRGLLDCT